MDIQVKDNKPIRITTGILQIIYSIGLFVFSGLLILLFAIMYGLAESLGGEFSANNLILIEIAKFVWFFISPILLVNAIMLLTKKPSKVIISILNIIYLVVVSVLFVIFGGIFLALAIVPIALLVLNVFVLINAKKVQSNKNKTFNQEQANAEEIIIDD